MKRYPITLTLLYLDKNCFGVPAGSAAVLKGLYFYTDATFMINAVKSSLISSIALKYFWDSPTDTLRDLGVDFDFNLSLRVPVYRSFFVAPYFEYLLFRGKLDPIRKYGTASTVGVSLGFSEIIKP